MVSHLSKITGVILIGAMLFSFVPCVSAGANAPQWDESKEWAYGGKEYLDVRSGTSQYDLISSLLPYLPSLLTRVSDVSLNNINVNGSVESYLYVSVTNVTSDICIVKVYVGTGATISGDVSISAKVSTYANGVQSGKISKNMIAAADIKMTQYSAMELRVDRNTLAIYSANATNIATLSFSVNARDIPLDVEGNTTFKSFRVAVNMNSSAMLNMTFTPALDLFKFPIDIGEKWYVSSMVAASGSVAGGLNVTGLDDDVLELLPFLDLNGTLDLSTIASGLSGADVDNGSFGPYSYGLSMKMHCVNTTNVDVGGTSYEAYVINVNEYSLNQPELVLYYVPGISFMSSVNVTSDILDEIDLGDDSNITLIRYIVQSNFDGELSMKYMEPSVAAEGIKALTGQEVAVKTPETTTGSIGLDMTLIFAMLAVVAVAAVALVLIVRKRK